MTSGASKPAAIWDAFGPLGIKKPPVLCEYAQQFLEWSQPICQRAIAGSSQPVLNGAMLLIQERYFDWRAAVPSDHRDQPDTSSHECLWGVYVRAYEQLRSAALAITPPAWSAPPLQTTPDAEPHAAQIAGIFLGEHEPEGG